MQMFSEVMHAAWQITRRYAYDSEPRIGPHSLRYAALMCVFAVS